MSGKQCESSKKIYEENKCNNVILYGKYIKIENIGTRKRPEGCV